MNIKILEDGLYYKPTKIKTPLVDEIKILYADYTGSGLPSPIIDKYLVDNIYPYYANTHSNSFCSLFMNDQIELTKNYIKKTMNVKPTQSILFTGNGTTGATNHLINSLNFNKYNKINVLISLYEHHSNFLPWVEKAKIYNNINIILIPLKDGLIDYNKYAEILSQLNKYDLTITSITACSNVSGIKTNLSKIRQIINYYFGNKGLLFVDYACSAPYVKIDASLCNAIFISPHKLIGGNSTPGLLIADSNLFMNSCPYAPGGGCVKKANDEIIEYIDDIEERESSGTPNIIGIIKIRLALTLKDKLFHVINHNEHEMIHYIHNKLYQLKFKYPQLTVLYLNKHLDIRLPIICISINNMHFNEIVKLMNDKFGIQTRGGISCSGLFAKHIENTMGIKGWCRISFHWSMTHSDVDYILYAIETILKENYTDQKEK
jgi:selenocysteine lyase/cysteine desulfurase